MNDNDIDDIGKRLYDLEADPPKDGWDKVYAGIQASTLNGKPSFLRRHWWKPLVILVTSGTIWYAVSQNENKPSGAGQLSSTLSTSASSGLSDLTVTTDSQTTLPQNEKGSSIDSQSKKEQNNTVQYRKSETRVNANQNKKKFYFQSETRQRGTQLKPAAIPTDDSTGSEVDNGSSLDRVKQNSSVKISAVADRVQETTPSLLEHAEQVTRSNSVPVQHSDSTATPEEVTKEEPVKEQQEQIEETKEAPIVKPEAKPVSRLSLSFTPHYINKSVQPVGSDDILITRIANTSDNFSSRSGFNLGLGYGRSLSSNVFIDAQLTFTQLRQNIFFSYATGAIDTLVTTREAAGTYRVTPVYVVSNREVSSVYNYGGIRIAASYYFWQRARHRFNITGSASVHQMLSSRIREKIDNRWTTRSGDGINKSNISLGVSAGYNLMFAPGWELMINPSLTYFITEVKSNELPYKMNQRAVGLQATIFKTIGMR